MSADRPRVALVVVTYNSRDLIDGFLQALPAAVEDLDVELVAVDNASGDGSADAVHAAAPDATVVRLGANRGYAAGLNAGIRAAADPDAVLVLNPDIRLGPGSVRRLLTAAGEPGAGIAVPRMTDPSGALVPSLRRDPSVRRALGEALLGGRRAGRFEGWGEMVTDPSAYIYPVRADWAVGAAMLVTRDCLDAVGAWDESLFLYSEETDYCIRARENGFDVRYEPGAEAVHIGGDAHVSPRLWALLTVNRVRLYRRRHGPVRSLAFRVAVMINEALRALAGRQVSRAALAALVTPGWEMPP